MNKEKVLAVAQIFKNVLNKRKRRFKIYGFILIGMIVIIAGWSIASIYSFMKAKKYTCKDMDVVLYEDKIIISGRIFPCSKKNDIYICPVLDAIKESNFLQPYVLFDTNKKSLYFSAKVDIDALKQEYSMQNITGKDICFISGLGYSKELDICVDTETTYTCQEN